MRKLLLLLAFVFIILPGSARASEINDLKIIQKKILEKQLSHGNFNKLTTADKSVEEAKRINGAGPILNCRNEEKNVNNLCGKRNSYRNSLARNQRMLAGKMEELRLTESRFIEQDNVKRNLSQEIANEKRKLDIIAYKYESIKNDNVRIELFLKNIQKIDSYLDIMESLLLDSIPEMLSALKTMMTDQTFKLAKVIDEKKELIANENTPNEVRRKLKQQIEVLSELLFISNGVFKELGRPVKIRDVKSAIDKCFSEEKTKILLSQVSSLSISLFKVAIEFSNTSIQANDAYIQIIRSNEEFKVKLNENRTKNQITIEELGKQEGVIRKKLHQRTILFEEVLTECSELSSHLQQCNTSIEDLKRQQSPLQRLINEYSDKCSKAESALWKCEHQGLE